MLEGYKKVIRIDLRLPPIYSVTIENSQMNH